VAFCAFFVAGDYGLPTLTAYDSTAVPPESGHYGTLIGSHTLRFDWTISLITESARKRVLSDAAITHIRVLLHKYLLSRGFICVGSRGLF